MYLPEYPNSTEIKHNVEAGGPGVSSRYTQTHAAVEIAFALTHGVEKVPFQDIASSEVWEVKRPTLLHPLHFLRVYVTE